MLRVRRKFLVWEKRSFDKHKKLSLINRNKTKEKVSSFKINVTITIFLKHFLKSSWQIKKEIAKMFTRYEKRNDNSIT